MSQLTTDTSQQSKFRGLANRVPGAVAVIRRFSSALPALFILIGAAAPFLIDSPFRLQVLTLAFLNAAVVTALTISLGYGGLLNLSQGTYYGLGAYTTAILVTEHEWSFFTAVIAAAVFAGFGGYVLALASLRVRDDYFVLVSLGFTFAIAQLMANLPSITRGREGFFGIPKLSLFGFSFNDPIQAYFLCLGLFAFVYAITRRLAHGFLGRSLLVVNHDDVAARSMGMPPFKLRATSMVISSGLAGICGGFLVGTIQFISPNDFGFDASFTMTLYAIIGGLTSLAGVASTAFIFTLLLEEFRSLGSYTVGLVGLAVIIAVFIRGGVVADVVRKLLPSSRNRNRR